jgi:hypothetical protein
MDSLVVTVAISALVSGLVALGIEWAAKPRLEARKEHRLEVYRTRRELKGNLLRIMFITSKWKDFDPPDGLMSEDELGRLGEEMTRGFQQLDELTKTMADNIEIYGGTLSPRRLFGWLSPQEAFASYIRAARSVMLSDGRPSQKLVALYNLTRPMESLFSRRLGRMPGALPALTEVLSKYDRMAAEANPPAKEPEHRPSGT